MLLISLIIKRSNVWLKTGMKHNCMSQLHDSIASQKLDLKMRHLKSQSKTQLNLKLRSKTRSKILTQDPRNNLNTKHNSRT